MTNDQLTSPESVAPVPEKPTSRGRSGFRVGSLEKGWAATAVFFVAMLLMPVYAAGSIPTFTDGLILLTMCYAWNLVGGFLGEFSFAHMLFWGLGAYATVKIINNSQSLVLGVVIILIVAALLGAFVAGLIKVAGLATSLALAIFTTVLGEIAVSYARGSDFLGGSEGLIAFTLPEFSPELMFIFLVLITALTAAINISIANTKFGREWLAIKDDQVAAHVAGINVERQRRIAYMISASLFALGGAYQSYYSGYAMPEVSLGIYPLILVSLAVFIGGPGTALGPLVGWIVIFGLEAIAAQLSSDSDISLYAQLTQFAVALLLIRLVLPRLKGLELATALARLPERFARGAAEPATDPAADGLNTEITTPAPERDGDGSGLKIIGVQKSFGALKVLQDVSFEIRPGEVVGIVGPNGAGKSTLCNLISGIETLTGGSITLDGIDISDVPTRRRTAIGMGRSFQTPRLFSSLSLTQNLMLSGRELTPAVARGVLADLNIPGADRRRGDDAEFFARRLTEVKKATLSGSAVLPLDEPLAGLTSDEHAIVLSMARAAADAGACVAIVEHLIPVLAPAVDRIVALADGHIIADGAPVDVLKEDAVIDAYLGKAHDMEEQA